MRADVVGTVDEISRDSLEELADDVCYTYAWLKTVEASRASFKVEPRYLVVYEEGRMIGFLPAFIADDFRFFNADNKSTLTKAIVSVANHAGVRLNRALICEPPCTSHSRILLEKNHDAKVVLSLLSKKIDELCRKEKIIISWLSSVPESDELLRHNLQSLGYFNASTFNSFYLDILWSSFDEYVGSLKRHHRKDVRREIEKCEASGVTIEEEKSFENHAATLSGLYLNLHSKYHNSGASPFVTSFFRNLQRYARDKARVFLAKKNGKIVGFSLCLQHLNVLDTLICGFDYGSLTKTDFTYFNLTYYTQIKLAIQEALERVYYRSTEDAIKLRRGCKLEKMYQFIKIHDRLLSPALRLYMRERQTTHFQRLQK